MFSPILHRLSRLTCPNFIHYCRTSKFCRNIRKHPRPNESATSDIFQSRPLRRQNLARIIKQEQGPSSLTPFSLAGAITPPLIKSRTPLSHHKTRVRASIVPAVRWVQPSQLLRFLWLKKRGDRARRGKCRWSWPNVCPSISAEDNGPLTLLHVHGSRKGHWGGGSRVRIRCLIWEGPF